MSLVGAFQKKSSLLQYYLFFFTHRKTSTFINFEWNNKLKWNYTICDLAHWPISYREFQGLVKQYMGSSKAFNQIFYACQRRGKINGSIFVSALSDFFTIKKVFVWDRTFCEIKRSQFDFLVQ